MFAHASGSILPVVVCDKKGKPIKMVAIQLIIGKGKKDDTTIVEARVKLDNE